MSDERCGYEIEDGKTCTTDFGLCDCHGQCYTHSPCREDDRQEARSRGGVATARKNRDVVPLEEAPAAPQTLEDAISWASWAATQVATGQLDTSRANSVARLLSEFRKLLEKSEAREALELVKEMRREMQVEDGES